MEKKNIKVRDKKALVLNIFSGCFGFVILLMLLSFIFRIAAPQQLQSKATNTIEVVNLNQPLKISIVNACGVDGIAKKLKGIINSNKYTILKVGNLNSFAEKSYIKCNSIDSNILELAAEIGIDESMIKSAQNYSSDNIITVVIGKDFSQLKLIKGK
jgi:hypothetical protein